MIEDTCFACGACAPECPSCIVTNPDFIETPEQLKEKYQGLHG